MWQFFEGNAFLMVSILVFLAVFLLLEGAYLFWKSYNGPDVQKMQRRLQAISVSLGTANQARLLRQRRLSDVPAIERMLLRMSRAQWLNKFILQAGLSWTVSRLVLSCAALGIAAWLLVALGAHQSHLLGGLLGACFAAIPLLYVFFQRSKRLAKLERQLPDALDLITRALRSGHAFSAALQMVGDEMADPIAGEFRMVHDEVNFGVALQQALANLSARVPLTDLRYFVVSVLIQRESGGNLTEVLGNLSRLIRERLKFMAKVKVLSAEGRLSAWILGIMPFALAGAMYLVNPGFMAPLWNDPLGISIMKYMLVVMAFGVLILQKVIRIRV